jgi:hypothetical protein
MHEHFEEGIERIKEKYRNRLEHDFNEEGMHIGG